MLWKSLIKNVWQIWGRYFPFFQGQKVGKKVLVQVFPRWRMNLICGLLSVPLFLKTTSFFKLCLLFTIVRAVYLDFIRKLEDSLLFHRWLWLMLRSRFFFNYLIDFAILQKFFNASLSSNNFFSRQSMKEHFFMWK